MQLGGDLLVGHAAHGALQLEAPQPAELNVGLHLDVKFERDRRADVPLQIVHVWVCDRLQGLLLDRDLPAFADQLLQRLLPDVVREMLLHDRRRGLALTEPRQPGRSEEHTSELQSQFHLVCRLLLEKKKNKYKRTKIQ